MSTLKRSISTAFALIASIGTLAYSGSAYAVDSSVGASWAVRTNPDLGCTVGAPCERASKTSGKIYGDYSFAVNPYNGFSITQSVEGMLYQIGEAKASFNTGSGVKSGNGKSSGAGVFYKVDLGTDDFGVIAKLGGSYAHGSVNFINGGSDSQNAWFLPAGGLGLRLNLSKNVMLTADWDRLPVKYSSTNSTKANNDMYSIGVAYKF